MFNSLSERLDKIFRNLKGKGYLTEQNIKDSLREIRLALLEADVNFKIVKNFMARKSWKALPLPSRLSRSFMKSSFP